MVTKTFVMLPMPKTCLSLIGFWLERSEKPAVEDHIFADEVQIAAEIPGTPAAMLESRRPCNLVTSFAREGLGDLVISLTYIRY